ncbi:uncharacterized protein LOC100176603 isoform X2 [Ciona intestinalis]
MKVIVAGFSKTGTKTMQAALKELGYNVYDYMENFEFLEKEWKQICTVGGSTDLFRKMYENIDAVTDLPGCIFWDEILKAFPEAKVVLTMRENEDVWYKSFKRQMTENVAWKHKIRIMFSYTAYRFYLYSSRLCQFSFGTEFGKVNETLSKMYYRRHNANVMQSFTMLPYRMHQRTNYWCLILKMVGTHCVNFLISLSLGPLFHTKIRKLA